MSRGDLTVRAARRRDLPQIIAIDSAVTGAKKPRYWQALLARYGAVGKAQRRFLVAEAAGRVVGFVIGEVRDWEFGAPPCGWVFTIDVLPDARQAGVGTRLLGELCACFRRAGVSTVRTMLARSNVLLLSFFRSQGMMAGPFIPLELELSSLKP